MNRAMLRVFGAAAFLLLVASLPAAASNYKVQLQNGTEFSTLYLPKEASWDPNKLIFLTSTGNWTAVEKDDVVKIISVLQQQGFGRILDDKTVEIGTVINDAPTEEELKAAEANKSDLDRYLDALREVNQPKQQQNYTVDQFVSPGEAGRGGGLPAGYGSPNAPFN